MSRTIAEQVEFAIAQERRQWSAMIVIDDGTPAVWEDLVRRSVGHTSRPFWPRLEATSAFTPSSLPEYYGLPAELTEEWLAYRDRWKRFLDLNPRARIADMLSDCSESHDSSSFPHGWEHEIKAWAEAGFPEPAPFYVNKLVGSDRWKMQLTDAMRRAGPGWVYMNDDVIYEWRVS